MVEPVTILIGVLMASSLLFPIFSGKKGIAYLASAIYLGLLAYLIFLYLEGDGLGALYGLSPGRLSFAVLFASLLAGLLVSFSLNKLGKRSGIAVSFVSGGILANFILSSTLNPYYIIASWGLLSASSYGIAAIPKDKVSLGNSLKYAFMGGLSFQFLILSFVLFYMYSTPLLGLPVVIGAALLAVAVGFKIGIVPFHMWLPEVYGSSDPVAVSALSSLMKLGAIALLLRLFSIGVKLLMPQEKYGLLAFLILLSLITMTWGNVAAAAQNDLQKMLAYSSISHVGFMLMAITVIVASYSYGVSPTLAVLALVIYFFSYSISKAGAFAYTKAFDDRKYESIKGAARTYSDVSGMFSISMLNLLGLPPLLGFWAKLFVFMTAANPALKIFYIGYIPWYSLIGILNSVISAFYYVRVIQNLYAQASSKASFEGLKATIIISSALLVVGGIILPFIVSFVF